MRCLEEGDGNGVGFLSEAAATIWLFLVTIKPKLCDSARISSLHCGERGI